MNKSEEMNDVTVHDTDSSDITFGSILAIADFKD